ncbi:MAG: pyridoxal-dependent decarboxylase [Chloroflexota bacterium]|nr:pyridoxal-dependent decarboxylase [Chloroflexota bacterium]
MTSIDPSRHGDAPALALAPERFRRLGYRAVDLATAHLAGIRDQPVFTPMTAAERQELLAMPLPAAAMEPETILDAVEALVLPHPMGNGHPRFFGWVNSPPAPIGVLVELLAAAMNPSVAGGDHAAVYVERAAVRWLAELVGFLAAESMGLLVSGGSMASLTALATARHRVAKQDGWDGRTEGLQGARATLTMYVSAEGHITLRKAAELLGLGGSAVRTIPVDDAFRMDAGALRAAIATDRAAGKRPFCVVASAGTVSTGAIDPLAAIADIAASEDLWFHIDGAYGAFGVLDPAIAQNFAGMERSDSLALDPHKWLSVPVECGCVLIRDGGVLRDAFSLVPPYLRTEEGRGIGGLPWYSEYGFQQTRGFRALKLWATLLTFGREGVVAHVARHNRLAQTLAGVVEAEPHFELLAPATLSIVCFRYVPATWHGDDERLNMLNKAIMEVVQASGEALLTQAVLHGRFALRANIQHYGTTDEDLEALVAVIRRTGDRLAAQ